MEIEEFIKKARLILKFYLESKCPEIFGDGTNFQLPVIPNVKELINNETLQQINAITKQYAHIYSKDIIASIGEE